jgi:hypothetical protein
MLNRNTSLRRLKADGGGSERFAAILVAKRRSS